MKSSDIAKYLGKELIGEDIQIDSFSSLNNLSPRSIVFAKKYKTEYVEVLNGARDVLAIVTDEYGGRLSIPYIVSANPRLDFLKVVAKFFPVEEVKPGIHKTSVIDDGATIGKNVIIGSHCYIGSQVTIGDDTIILPNVSIYSKVRIGSGCYIKPGAVIGGPGFGFEFDENDVPVHFPHTGEVIIGNNVYIGANTSIDRATIDATIIEDDVKIDDLVHVAHNCHIGKNTLITGGAMLGGGVKIGRNSWIAPNSTILQQLKIGDNAKVGIGSVVLRNVKDKTVVFGIPAKKSDF